MAEDEHDYKVGPGRPLQHTRFKEGQSRKPGGLRKKDLPAFLADALNEPVFITIMGTAQDHQARSCRHNSVNKSTMADLRATNVLFDMMKDAEQKAGVVATRSFG